MPNYKIISCPKCFQKLRIPANLEKAKLKCPACQTIFVSDRQSELNQNSNKNKRVKSKQKLKLILFACAALIVLIISVVYITNIDKKSTSITESFKHQVTKPKWITISYGDLLDDNVIIRTGQLLKSTISEPNL